MDDTPKPEPKKEENASAAVRKVENGTGTATPTPGRGPISVVEKAVSGSLGNVMVAGGAAGGSRSATPKQTAVELEEDSDEEGMEATEGMSCKRRSCGKVFDQNVTRQEEKCVFHPGVPLFHEGSKGWTCCKRRVLEFEEFLKIEGCKERKGHCYVGKRAKEKSKGEEVLEDVRNDFYQTPTSVIVSFYLKKIDKENAIVEFDGDGRTVKLDLPTADGKRYKADVELWGEVEPSQCKSRVLGTKLELTLAKKGDSQVGWPVLRSSDRDTGERIQVGRAGTA